MAEDQRPPVFELHIRPMFRLLDREHMLTFVDPGFDLWNLEAVWTMRNDILVRLRGEGLFNMPGERSVARGRRSGSTSSTAGRRTRTQTTSGITSSSGSVTATTCSNAWRQAPAAREGHGAAPRLSRVVRARVGHAWPARVHALRRAAAAGAGSGPDHDPGARDVRQGRRDDARHPRRRRHTGGARRLGVCLAERPASASAGGAVTKLSRPRNEPGAGRRDVVGSSAQMSRDAWSVAQGPGGRPMSHHLSASPKRARSRLLSVGIAALLAAAALSSQAEAAAPAQACDKRNNNTYEKLLGCVTLEGVREHQAAFQAIADASDDPVYPGTRAAGTEGYAASVEYVAGLSGKRATR